MSGNRFVPAQFTIAPGDTVSFVMAPGDRIMWFSGATPYPQMPRRYWRLVYRSRSTR